MNGATRWRGSPARTNLPFYEITKLWFKRDDVGSSSIARRPLRIGGIAARRSVRHFIQFAVIFFRVG